MEWIAARLKEPTTYGGIASILALIGVQISPEMQSEIITICMGVGGVLMVLMREKGDS